MLRRTQNSQNVTGHSCMCSKNVFLSPAHFIVEAHNLYQSRHEFKFREICRTLRRSRSSRHKTNAPPSQKCEFSLEIGKSGWNVNYYFDRGTTVIQKYGVINSS
ncbi:uncharacterized protein LOC144633328 isoform X1 [Oculina patagonica]